MRVIVLGADGYLGWPTALHLSAQGHEIIAADNLIRRRWDVLCGTESLVPIASMKRRVERWKALTGREIKWEKLDLTSLADTTALITQYQPEAIVHFAEQRSAPYSMISAQHAVYGTGIPETDMHGELRTRFDYDDIWGTVLNRFCSQAAIGYPLTVYGEGGQTRGFLDIRDTVRCVELAMLNAPERGEYRVFNQFTEQFSVRELAERVKLAREHHGLETSIEHLPNPRAELETHYYNAKHQHLLDLGLVPHKLEDSLIDRVIGLVERYKKRIRSELFVPRVDWRRGGTGDFGKPAAKRRRVAVAPAIR